MSDHTFGLNLHLLSFDLPRNVIKEGDTIRVSITTMPEENKQHFSIPARRMRNANLNFNVNVKLPSEGMPDDFVFSGTEKIIICFRKKNSFWGCPIIASTVISSKEFPKNFTDPIQVKTFNVYEPIQNGTRACHEDNSFIGTYEHQNRKQVKIDRRIIGRMQVEMSLHDSIPLKDIDEDDMYTVKKATSVTKAHEDYNDENLMFIDNFDEYCQLK